MAFVIKQNGLVRQVVRDEQRIAVLGRNNSQSSREGYVLHVIPTKTFGGYRSPRRHLDERVAGDPSVLEVVNENAVADVALLLTQRIGQRPNGCINAPPIAGERHAMEKGLCCAARHQI